VLGEPTYRSAAGQIKAEMAAAPTLDDVINELVART